MQIYVHSCDCVIFNSTPRTFFQEVSISINPKGAHDVLMGKTVEEVVEEDWKDGFEEDLESWVKNVCHVLFEISCCVVDSVD